MGEHVLIQIPILQKQGIRLLSNANANSMSFLKKSHKTMFKIRKKDGR